MLRWLGLRRAARPIPDPLWRDTMAAYPFLAQRPQTELAQLRELSTQFLATKEFTGANGLVITDRIAVAIAAQAVLPVLHLGLHWYDDFVGIVVHPGEVLARRTQTDEHGVVHHYDEVLAGEAMEGGPVMINWSDAQSAGETAQQGYNVVIHEFIHKIDMRDGEADGCPPLASRAARAQWLAVLQSAYDAFREQVIIAQRFGGEEPWLDAYAAQSPDEFFAVSCEAYFVNAPRFRAEFPTLVPLLDGFFRVKNLADAKGS